MLNLIGKWTNKSKVAGSPVEDFYFGEIRVARVTLQFSSTKKGGKSSAYRMYQHHIFLPGTGASDIGFSWSLEESKKAVEAIVDDWLWEAGINDVFELGQDEAADALEIPDSIVVLQGIKIPPASAKILPIAERRAISAAAKASHRPIYVDDKSSSPKKKEDNGRRSLTRGQ